MKKMFRLLLIATTVAVLQRPALAGGVTGPTTFTAGTPAKASEVNGNFSAVKTAIDDNDARLTTIENKIAAAGAVSVTAHAFSDFYGNTADASGCHFVRSQNFGYFQETSGGCIASASVALLHGATLQSLTCLIYDNEATPNFYPVTLVRMNLATGALDTVFTTSATSTSVGVESLSAARRCPAPRWSITSTMRTTAPLILR